MIREALSGKRVALTGATGFLGTALLERLLLDIPAARLDVIVRGDAAGRLAGLLAGSAFGPARERLGPEQLAALAREKARPISCDLAADAPPVADDVDLVIHAAATVSFDPPIDEAFELNLGGSIRTFEAAAGRPFVHISTAYVAGLTRGIQREELLTRDIDWRAEHAWARRARDEAEEFSRRPETLERLEARARRALGRTGPQTVAARAEGMRSEWVRARLVRAGRARAQSLGWPDVYSFTKALTELALDELAGDGPITIVRPSIIESALERPYPGWIEGFRMAEPILLAFGRGALPEFPGIPESVIDIIPVDYVVNGILAAAAQPPRRRAVYHISSGSRNPLPFRDIYEITRAYYLAHPLPERGRGAYRVPAWRFPGRRWVERRLRLADRALERANAVVGRLPRGTFARESARRVDRLRGRLDFLKRYAGLYTAYAEAEVIYTDEEARALSRSLPEQDRRDFPFDPADYTWRHYLGEVHLPAVTTALRTPRPPRPQPAVAVRPNGGSRPVIAAFDVEGTLVASNVVESYLWLRLAEEGAAGRARTLAGMARRLPSLLGAERRDRGEFLRSFYRLYEGVDAAALRRLAREEVRDLILQRLSPAAVRRVRAHRAAGHRVVFITGSLDVIAEALAPLADEVIAARIVEAGGVLTGDLERPPLVGEARASWLREYARTLDADLGASYAYADSMSDLPMLEVVGNPAAVNPDVSLARIARARRWPVEEWSHDRGTPKVLVPGGVS